MNAKMIRAHRLFRSVLATLVLTITLALASMPGRADTDTVEVWLYAPGGAYDAIGYTVGGGHVADPIGDEIGVVDGQGNVYDNNGNLIGYIVTVDTP